MGTDWLDELGDQTLAYDEDSRGDGLYCPYTNGPECALFAKGWQPQELCGAMECDQLKLFDRAMRRRKVA